MILTKAISRAVGERFLSFMLCVVGVNSLLMVLECDIPDFLYCWVVEVGLLRIYIFELVLRMRVSGCPTW